MRIARVIPSGVSRWAGSFLYGSRFFLFNILDRLLQRGDERRRVCQGLLRQLKFRHQDACPIDDDQPIACFHGLAPLSLEKEPTTFSRPLTQLSRSGIFQSVKKIE